MPNPIASPESGGRHTPGEWIVRKGLHGSADELSIWAPFAPVPGNHEKVATLCNPHGNHAANARLIAAAPCMDKALRLLARVRPTNWQDDPDDVAAWSALDAALSRASASL